MQSSLISVNIPGEIQLNFHTILLRYTKWKAEIKSIQQSETGFTLLSGCGVLLPWLKLPFSVILYPLSMTCSGLESYLVPLDSEYSTLKSNYKYLVRIFCEYTCYWKWFGHWNRMIDFESPPSGFQVFILRPLGYEPLKISVWTCELISVGEIAQWFLLFVGHSTSTQGDNFSWK